MDKKRIFDFWYAVNNTEVVLLPSRHIETFGSTMLNYHLVSELMDNVNQIRVREGRMRTHRPQIITPESYSQTILEGFGDEARKYVDWLKQHEHDVRILQYGYTLKNEAFNEHFVSGDVKAVAEQVKADVKKKNDRFSAVLVGVDQPWDVCLIKLFWEVINSSAPANIKEMEKQRLFEYEGNTQVWVKREIEKAFLKASREPAFIKQLAATLKKYGVFEEYQDRFFALVKEK